MFQQDNAHDIFANAKLQAQIKSAVRELNSVMDTLFELEESTGIEVDVELISACLIAIEKLQPDKCAQISELYSFEESWARFVESHPDLFPPEEPAALKMGYVKKPFHSAGKLFFALFPKHKGRRTD